MAERVLIAYYTHSGNTERVAETIHREVGGDMHAITPATPYPREYGGILKQAKREIRKGDHPKLSSNLVDIEGYDEIFIGSPNWWSTIAPPVATFLASHDFTGKTILPFCSHGGGGTRRVERDVAKLCPGARVTSCLGIAGRLFSLISEGGKLPVI
jgi:flavodoxin